MRRTAGCLTAHVDVVELRVLARLYRMCMSEEAIPLVLTSKSECSATPKVLHDFRKLEMFSICLKGIRDSFTFRTDPGLIALTSCRGFESLVGVLPGGLLHTFCM